MRGWKTVVAAACLAVVALPAGAQLEMPRTSPAASVTQRIGVADLSFEFHRPGAKGRTVWGVLVPYGEVWRMGANERTVFTASHDVLVEGQPLAAGRYGVLAIPSPSRWTLIFTHTADAWGHFDYAPEDDALRVEVQPREAPFREWMELRFEDLREDSAEAVLHWARLEVPFRISLDLEAQVLAGVAGVVRWEHPYQAAAWALERGTHLDDARRWIEASLALEENFWNLAAKARLLALDGDHGSAATWGARALEAVETMAQPPPEAYRRELEGEIERWKARRPGQ